MSFSFETWTNNVLNKSIKNRVQRSHRPTKPYQTLLWASKYVNEMNKTIPQACTILCSPWTRRTDWMKWKYVNIFKRVPKSTVSWVREPRVRFSNYTEWFWETLIVVSKFYSLKSISERSKNTISSRNSSTI